MCSSFAALFDFASLQVVLQNWHSLKPFLCKNKQKSILGQILSGYSEAMAFTVATFRQTHVRIC